MDIVLLQLGAPVAVERFVLDRDTDDADATAASQPNLATAFATVARHHADHPAVVSKDGVFSYGWLLQAANRVRRHLCARSDHKAGALVALELSNSVEYLAAYYGVLLADCVVVPLPVALEAARKREIYRHCQPDVMISRAEDFNAAQHDGAVANLHLCDEAEPTMAFAAPRRSELDLAMLLFTSGSTGAPKGVMLSHRNLLANANSILHVLPIDADDRALVVLPFCHAFGNSIVQTHILSGATLLLRGALTFPSSIVDAMRDLRATSFSAVPEVYGMLLKYGRLGERPLPELRYMAVAGGPLRHDLSMAIARLISPASFHVMYGQSEATSRLASLAPGDLDEHGGSIGKPIPGVELAVMDEANRELPANAVGMLCARGDNVMSGYWGDPAGTADVLGPDGWLRTGDLARRDEAGYFYIQGRANLLVKVQGYRVHPAEIESVVEASFPQVRAVALPVSHDGGTRFVLFLAPLNDNPIDVAVIRETCQKALPSYKQPTDFEVLAKLPLTPAYKVDRAALGLLVPARPGSAAALRPTG
jgi:acyl-CoA synthetase (AMP-forming)/AMP-acid ligase II